MTPDAGRTPEPDLDPVDGDGPDQLGWAAHLVRTTGLVLVPLAAVVFAYTYLVNDVADLSALDYERRWSRVGWQFVDWTFFLVAVVHLLVAGHLAIRRHVRDGALRIGLEGVSAGILLVAFGYASLAIL